MSDRRKSGHGAMLGWTTRRKNERRAADEIERLEAALRRIADTEPLSNAMADLRDIARAALEQKP